MYKRKYVLSLIHPDGKRETHYAMSQSPLRQIRSKTPKNIIASDITPIFKQPNGFMAAMIKHKKGAP